MYAPFCSDYVVVALVPLNAPPSQEGGALSFSWLSGGDERYVPMA